MLCGGSHAMQSHSSAIRRCVVWSFLPYLTPTLDAAEPNKVRDLLVLAQRESRSG